MIWRYMISRTKIKTHSADLNGTLNLQIWGSEVTWKSRPNWKTFQLLQLHQKENPFSCTQCANHWNGDLRLLRMGPSRPNVGLLGLIGKANRSLLPPLHQGLSLVTESLWFGQKTNSVYCIYGRFVSIPFFSRLKMSPLSAFFSTLTMKMACWLPFEPRGDSSSN